LTWFEFWLFLHISGAIVWVGGAAAVQIFGILTKRAADPAKTAFFAQSVSWTVMRVFLPAAIVVFVAGFGVTDQSFWEVDDAFVVYGLVAGGAVAIVAFGYLGRAIGAAGVELAANGPSPALGLRMRNLVWLSRVLLLVLATIVFEMVAKLGS
jgi:hypothetical protein